MSFRSFLSISLAATLLLIATPALSDGVPHAGAEDPTRPIALPDIKGAPVYIDTAYIDVLAGPSGEADSQDTGCVRYRNVASETTTLVRFKRTFLDASHKPLGSDFTEDHKARKPNKGAMPGTVPVAAGYWVCTQKTNPYGAKVRAFVITPAFVKFSSGKTWQAP
jgi:hypothetical protein